MSSVTVQPDIIQGVAAAIAAWSSFLGVLLVDRLMVRLLTYGPREK